jgi:serine/threonine-protein kinase
VASDAETAPPVSDPAQDVIRPRAEGAPAAPLPAMIGRRYRPIRLIAKGGMGAVYEVVHANTGEHLALKLMLARSLLTPELVERFRREARIHSSVKSEHVVRVVDADVAHEIDDVPFLVMELLNGQDFERICLERQPSSAEVVGWMRQLAIALDKAHAEGVVHRDLKPENLFLAERDGLPPIVKILDFGVAKIATEGDGQATATGQILGTPRYMAPEQAVDAKQISAAADRFALGLIAFRLLCGRHYFAGDNMVVLLSRVGRGPQERPSALGSKLGPAFDAWFARACALSPRDRFATCAAQVEALAQAVQGGSSGVSPGRMRRRAVAIGVCGLAGLVGWALHRAAPRGTPETAPPGLKVQAIAPSPTSPTPSPPAKAAAPALPGETPSASAPVRRRLAPKRAQSPAPAADPTDHTWDEP